MGVWIVLLAAAVFSYGRFCDWFFTQTEFLDPVNNKRAWNLVHKNQSFDFAVLGNSRAYGGFDMNLLNEKLGKKGINLSAPGSGFVDNYLTLDLFLKNNNQIKEIFLQVDLYSLNSRLTLQEPFHKYHFAQYWNDPVVKGAILDFSSDREVRILSMFPESRYVKFNKYYSLKEIARRYQMRNTKISTFDKTLGGITDISLSRRKPIGKDLKQTPVIFKPDPKDVKYLRQLILLCQTYNIRVTAFRSPEYGPAMARYSNYEDAYSEIKNLLKQMEIPFLMLKSDLENNREYFYDPVHLRKPGLIPFTNVFVGGYSNFKSLE
jgi:hypothetical protein